MPSATIIGAGPAGSVTALLVARAGWNVTIVERHLFPREKVCGECLSHLGFEVLARLGLTGALSELGAVKLKRAILHARDGTSAEIALPEPMWGLSRNRLDPMLLAEAVRSGAQLIQPARAEAITADPIGVTIRQLSDNALESIRSNWVVVADGRAALLPGRPESTGELGIKAHFNEVDSEPGAIELFGVTGHYVGVAPIEGGAWNVAYAAPENRVRDCPGDLDELYRWLLDENPALSWKFRNARRTSTWTASPLPRFGVRADWPAGVVPVGNAAAAVEPIGGEGMGLAMASGEMAAGALIEAKEDYNHPAVLALPARYRRLWGARGVVCRMGAILLSRPVLSPVSVDLLRSIPSLGGVSLGLMGK